MSIRQLACVVWLSTGLFASEAAPPNIVLITIDTTRADRMGFLGSQRGLTPNLDALARQSVVFTRAYSQAPLTATSHATILTGTYPQFHQVNYFGMRLGADLPYAPDILRAHGYHTAAFVGAMVLDPKAHAAPGFDRGFDSYDAGFSQGAPGSDRYETSERRGGVVVAHAVAWLDTQAHGPFFLWVHLYDPHDPYDPPEPYKSRYKSAPYDGEIAYADSAVGKLLRQLRGRGLYENSVIAVMSDHGEGLGEHGEDTHGVFLYDETIHIPLVIKLPEAGSAGKRIEKRVGLVDVLPTILEAVGIAVPKAVQGESLLGMMKSTAGKKAGTKSASDAALDRSMYAETDYPYILFRWSPLRSLRTGKYLFIEAPRRELYDQEADPKAEHNLARESSAVADTLAHELATLRQNKSGAGEAPTANLDPGLEEKLTALGYIAAGSGARSGAEDMGADPKDKIEIINSLHRAGTLEDELHYKEAIVLLEEVIAKAPDASVAYSQLGLCYLSLQDYKNAVPVLRKATELRPDWVKERLQLGIALLAIGDAAAAEPELRVVVSKATLLDQLSEAHLMLGTAYSQTDRAREAIAECEKVLEVVPRHYGALLLEGRILVLSKQPEAALPRLEQAAAIRPKAAEPHMALADAYVQLGREADATREWTEVKRLVAKPH